MGLSLDNSFCFNWEKSYSLIYVFVYESRQNSSTDCLSSPVDGFKYSIWNMTAWIGVQWKTTSFGHSVFPMVTNPEWIPTRSIHNGNKYPFDLETYFQNGNCFHLIWISLQRKFLNQLETVSKQNGNRFYLGNMFPNQIETVSILEIEHF